jgi:hypothetical protein
MRADLPHLIFVKSTVQQRLVLAVLLTVYRRITPAVNCLNAFDNIRHIGKIGPLNQTTRIPRVFVLT